MSLGLQLELGPDHNSHTASSTTFVRYVHDADEACELETEPTSLMGRRMHSPSAGCVFPLQLLVGPPLQHLTLLTIIGRKTGLLE